MGDCFGDGGLAGTEGCMNANMTNLIFPLGLSVWLNLLLGVVIFYLVRELKRREKWNE